MLQMDCQKGLSSIYGAREILRYVQDKIKTYFVTKFSLESFPKAALQ